MSLVDVSADSVIPDIYRVMPPLTGSPEAPAEKLGAFGAEGIAHVRLMEFPMTLFSVEAMAPMLEVLDRT